MVPGKVAGTSIEVLSVSISNRLSPGLTASPACLNHFTILPSVTVSPSCGIRTSITCLVSLDAFPSDFQCRIGRPQHQPVADELDPADEIAGIARLNGGLPVMRHRPGRFVDRIGAKIGDVVLELSLIHI